jgi:hypothetical protein
MLHGRVVNNGSTVGYVDIEIVKDNDTIMEVSTQRNGGYKINLDLGSQFNIAFSKKGYIKKTVSVIGISAEEVGGRYFYQLDIELIKTEEDRVDETMLPPVAKLYIKDPDDGFTYDKKYVKWVADEYEELEE